MFLACVSAIPHKSKSNSTLFALWIFSPVSLFQLQPPSPSQFQYEASRHLHNFRGHKSVKVEYDPAPRHEKQFRACLYNITSIRCSIEAMKPSGLSTTSSAGPASASTSECKDKGCQSIPRYNLKLQILPSQPDGNKPKSWLGLYATT